MKIVLIFGGIILLLFIIVQIYDMSAQRGTETYPYEVEKTYSNIEIRQYGTSLFTSVKCLVINYEDVSSKGFSVF